jgi:hypothetical protein
VNREDVSVGSSSSDPGSLEHEPTFILGPARSGTSLLYKLLCLHPDAAWISNWVARYPMYPQLAALNRLARRLPAAARTVWFGRDSNAYVYGRRRPPLHRAFPMPVEGEPVYASAGAVDTGGPGEPAIALARAFERIRRFGGGSRFISKRIGNNLRIPLLTRTFPRARFIEMVRDGRAVAYSLSRVDWWPDSTVWWYGRTPQAWEAEGRDPWELCARNWIEERRRVRQGLAEVPDERVSRLRYEDLIADPFGTLPALGGFVGFRDDPSWMGTLRRLTFPDRNEGWKERLAPAVADRITALQHEDLRELGYV